MACWDVQFIAQKITLSWRKTGIVIERSFKIAIKYDEIIEKRERATASKNIEPQDCQHLQIKLKWSE